ncbi:type II secretion system protein GspL [Gallaecimonas xiamenensis]|uniref:Type II secretion system protein L n=1 Tax=Gallaecimonas xiamenensis 3-C-1 TaxID=745411 RepID=K2JQH9_9GAMM|nr:type II secretion system protein GspL [Gallaecimonas xiamenensis]EKE77563.1 general secretion pathway protein L [Gallaecimonas xiamenensis 3-C-1]
MTNTLVIRLPLTDDQGIPWLHWSGAEQAVLASGTLPGPEALTELARLDGRLLVLVPGSACFMGSVKQAGKGRQFLRAVPFALEEELADDVDSLHFTLKPQGEQVAAVAVRHQLMEQWLGWLQEAQLSPWKLLPDCLALPWQPHSWSALVLGQELLLRTQESKGLCIEAALADWIVAPLAEETSGGGVQPVEAYGDLSLPPNCTLTHLDADLPLAVLAKGGSEQSLDLLHGPYQQKRKGKGPLNLWWPALASLAALLVIALAGKGVALYQYSAQTQALEAQIKADYGRLFSGERLVSAGSLKSQLRGKLKNLGSGAQEASLLAMLNDLSLTFAKVGNIKPDNLRFDAGRGELRVLTMAPDFATFERLKQQLANRYQVESGGQSTVEGGVTGTLILRSKG